MRAFGLVAVLSVLCSCSQPQHCTPAECGGCCDANDKCQTGTSALACGINGNACGACTSAQQCQLGVCTAGTGGGSSGGGSGGSGGGGGAGGGGSGGGTGGSGGGSGGGVADAGPDPLLVLDRGSLGFGREFDSGTWLGTAPQQSLLLSNGGRAALTVSGAAVSGADATAFGVALPASPTTIAFGQQSFVRVLFTPTQARLYSATLTLTSNAGAPVTVPLTGQGVGAMDGGSSSNPECRGSDCSSPLEVGGGCGSSASTWLTYAEDGMTLRYTDDSDGDGRADDVDNCPWAANRDQLDSDGDGVGDVCDNCASSANANQLDTDADGQGDICDVDLDGDGFANVLDNCPLFPNPTQTSTDGDALGDVCDTDDDGDGYLDTVDLCPLLAHTPNELVVSPSCDHDADADTVSDSFDNCPLDPNPSQQDTDADGLGDACDKDIDNDGVPNQADNCATVRNRDQRDDDGDGVGDACDARYCAVVDPSQPTDCLDPLGPFRVHAGGSVTMRAGERFRLPLFANRNNAAITYTWTVTSRPVGSTAAVVNATGLAGLSRHWQYAYVDGRVPTFTPDSVGTFVLQLQAQLGMADRAYPAQTTSVATLRLDAAP